MNGHLTFVAETLRVHKKAGGRARFMGVPVRLLSREALLGLVGYLGSEQIRQDESRDRERAMWKDIARAGRQG